MNRWVVVDLEATCWMPSDDPYLAKHQSAEAEIIEIGAVCIDPATLRVVDEFAHFVRPVHHPELSRFCTKLTSITQDQVDAARPFDEVVRDFRSWMEAEDDTELWSWGRYDHSQLRRELERASLPEPRWQPHDLKDAFGTFVRRRSSRGGRFGLARALSRLGWRFEGSAHRGIDDARNAGRVLRHIRDPANRTEEADVLLSLMARHEPRPTTLREAKAMDRKARHWWPGASQELLELSLATDLGEGRGLLRTERARTLGPPAPDRGLPPQAG